MLKSTCINKFETMSEEEPLKDNFTSSFTLFMCALDIVYHQNDLGSAFAMQDDPSRYAFQAEFNKDETLYYIRIINTADQEHSETILSLYTVPYDWNPDPIFVELPNQTEDLTIAPMPPDIFWSMYDLLTGEKHCYMHGFH